MSAPAIINGRDLLKIEIETAPDGGLTATAGTTRPLFLSLAEILKNPDALKPPAVVLPRLAWRGYATAFCAGDKMGKSTTAAAGVTELSQGGVFLDERCGKGHTAWVGLEENVNLAAKRFYEMGADPDYVHLVTLSPPDLLQQVRAFLKTQPVDLLVLDSLMEYARVITGNKPPAEGDTAGWSMVCRPLVQVARESDLALLILHHVRRSDGQYRGSTEVAAAVDCLWEMSKNDKDPDMTTRRFKGRARWETPDFAIRRVGGRYELAGGAELSLDVLVLLSVERNPGTSKNKIREQVGKRASDVDAALKQLLDRGAIRNEGSEERAQYYAGLADQQAFS